MNKAITVERLETISDNVVTRHSHKDIYVVTFSTGGFDYECQYNLEREYMDDDEICGCYAFKLANPEILFGKKMKPYVKNTAETDKADYEYIMARCAPLDMLSTVVLKDIICELQNEIDDRPGEAEGE